MKACLASGYPFVFGFTVYESFESAEVARTGLVPMPAHDESVLGYHAVVAVGHHDGEQIFICRNSWGSDWGSEGHFFMPYAYLLSSGLSSDFWTIRSVE
jgi:C1A family cysteine protease